MRYEKSDKVTMYSIIAHILFYKLDHEKMYNLMNSVSDFNSRIFLS